MVKTRAPGRPTPHRRISGTSYFPRKKSEFVQRSRVFDETGPVVPTLPSAPKRKLFNVHVSDSPAPTWHCHIGDVERTLSQLH